MFSCRDGVHVLLSLSKYYNRAELAEVKASLTNIEDAVTLYASKALLSFGIAF